MPCDNVVEGGTSEGRGAELELLEAFLRDDPREDGKGRN